MSLALGLVGLPNSGKSTLFNALSRARALVASYPFTTIEPNVGVVQVPDRRLDELARLIKPQKVTPTTVEFVDVAGLVRGASTGEGLGNQFLGHIRNVDAVVFVLRCFQDADVPHVYGEIDPVRDAEILAVELALADLATVERRVEHVQTPARSGDKQARRELDLLVRLREHLNRAQPARTLPLDSEEADLLATFNLLTAKPVLYVANLGEADFAALAGGGPSPEVAAWLDSATTLAAAEGSSVVPIAAKLEMELAELSPEEAREYLDSLGVRESGLDKLIQASYRLLSLVTFFTTTGGKEVRAWTVVAGTKAPQAAGKVHSDMERGFIRAEVVSFHDLVAAGSLAVARERGQVRVEGRDYVVQDGDVVHFRFAV